MICGCTEKYHCVRAVYFIHSEIMVNNFIMSCHVTLDSVAKVLPWAYNYLSQGVTIDSPRTTYWPICLLGFAMFVWLFCFRSLIWRTRAKPAPRRRLYWYAIERGDHSQSIFFLNSRGVQDAHRHASCRYQNLSATFLSYKLQNSDRPYSAVESAQPGPSFEKLRFRSLSCCQSLTSLNLHTMQCLKTFGGCESLEKLQVCRRRVLAQTPLSQTRCKLCIGEHTQIWRCTKLVRVQISRCWKLLLQCIDVEACQKLDFLVIQGSCEMGLSN